MKTIVTFLHGGKHIHNPFKSECGRFDVEPEHYGFVGEDVSPYGESVTLWKKTTDTGWEIHIVESHPEGKPHRTIVGYRPDGTMWHYNTLDEAIEVGGLQ